MILESLLELVETLKARIDTHGDQLRQSEALTRYALIDPLLRELGWDTEDPKLVRPEYPLRTEYTQSTRFADYALLEGTQDKPAMMVEAKESWEVAPGSSTIARDQLLSGGWDTILFCDRRPALGGI